MMSGALRWMALLSSDKNKEEYRRDRSEDRYRDERYDEDRYHDGDRRRKPYDERRGYQMRERHAREDEWEPKRLTKADAESWVRRMKNADGSAGEHWDYGQTEQVRQQKGYKCDPVAFYATMNMMYSDYSQIARETGCNTVDFYAGMAHAFLDDADAPADKIERYMEYIAEA